MTPDQAETERIGIELMTAWCGSESNSLFRDRLRALLGETRLVSAG